MIQLTGNKIFILYPDKFLREEIFHGSLRNQFQIFYIFDYEKIRPLIEYFPGSIICINLVENDLGWLIEELKNELSVIAEDEFPRMAILSDKKLSDTGSFSRLVEFGTNPDAIKSELQQMFIDWGGKGRRNFVRYGGSGEAVAVISAFFAGNELRGTVHDVSAGGLSCSFKENAVIPISDKEIRIKLDLSDITLELSAIKILERDFNKETIHVLQFDKGMSKDRLDALYRFIHQSLDSSMDQFIKKLSN
ncbi:MAG: PilZ domain-containing protein [Spirochaetales bacterium]|nr:PilZ domain-containing protein [Spirochaetales bacterium]